MKYCLQFFAFYACAALSLCADNQNSDIDIEIKLSKIHESCSSKIKEKLNINFSEDQVARLIDEDIGNFYASFVNSFSFDSDCYKLPNGKTITLTMQKEGEATTNDTQDPDKKVLKFLQGFVKRSDFNDDSNNCLQSTTLIETITLEKISDTEFRWKEQNISLNKRDSEKKSPIGVCMRFDDATDSTAMPGATYQGSSNITISLD